MSSHALGRACACAGGDQKEQVEFVDPPAAGPLSGRTTSPAAAVRYIIQPHAGSACAKFGAIGTPNQFWDGEFPSQDGK